MSFLQSGVLFTIHHSLLTIHYSPDFGQLPARKKRLPLICKVSEMKNIVFGFVLSASCLSAAIGQRLPVPDTNKYRIDLPSYWKPGNKVWKILTDKLPLVCPEIKDKEICGDDCNPGYTLQFEMSDPVIFEYFPNHINSIYTNTQFRKPSETWDIQTQYGFECSLLLRNDKGVLITRFILVDTNEVWNVSHRVTLASYSPPPIQASLLRRTRVNRYGVVDPNPPSQAYIPETGQEGETPYSYINRNREKLTPTYRDLFAIVDMKINSW
jgi:hypothetical protein